MLWPAIALTAALVAVVAVAALLVLARRYEHVRNALDAYERRALRLVQMVARPNGSSRSLGL